MIYSVTVLRINEDATAGRVCINCRQNIAGKNDISKILPRV